MARKVVYAGRTAAASQKSTKPKKISLADLVAKNPGHEQKRKIGKSGGLSLADRIQAEREQLFKAMSLVECCKYASASLLDVEATDSLVGVYELLYDVLDSAAGGLGCIIEECRLKSSS